MVIAGYPIPGIDFRGYTFIFLRRFGIFPFVQRPWHELARLQALL
jgi:hypothetical protein